MDTRQKIISYEQALDISRERAVRWISGHFDPLLAEHAARLEELRRPDELMVVVVSDPPEPLLSSRARAELVAALAVVDYVVMREGRTLQRVEEDLQIRRRFMDRVLARHGGEPV